MLQRITERGPVGKEKAAGKGLSLDGVVGTGFVKKMTLMRHEGGDASNRSD